MSSCWVAVAGFWWVLVVVVVVVVDDVVVVVVVDVDVVVVVVVAPNTPLKTDSKGARARAARNNNKQPERTGVHKQQKPWYLRCFCSKRESKN